MRVSGGYASNILNITGDKRQEMSLIARYNFIFGDKPKDITFVARNKQLP